MMATSKTIKEYTINYRGYNLVIPVGSIVSNRVSGGAPTGITSWSVFDNNYHFWTSWRKQIEEITGIKDSMLKHDLTHYGLNIPAEYCEPYPEEWKS